MQSTTAKAGDKTMISMCPLTVHTAMTAKGPGRFKQVEMTYLRQHLESPSRFPETVVIVSSFVVRGKVVGWWVQSLSGSDYLCVR